MNLQKIEIFNKNNLRDAFSTQLNPNEQLTSRTGKVVDSIFQELRDDIYSQSKLNSVIFSFFLVLFFLWCLCLIVLFFSLRIFL